MKSVFVCFIGIDGSGKTFHAKTLVKLLKRNGIKCKYVWGRWTPFLLKPFEILLKKFYLKSKKIDCNNYDEYVREKRRIIGNYKLALIWEYLVLLDYCIQVLLKVRLPLILGKTVICDRYIYDTLVDLTVDFNFSGKEPSEMFRSRVLSLFPKPNLTFLLDVPETVAYKRKGDLESINYLVDRRKTYIGLSQDLQAVVLDNSKNFSEIQKFIIDAVKLAMTNR
jgi:dTMP kinase